MPETRADSAAIEDQAQRLRKLPFVNEIINAMPYLVVILNKQRQIVCGNEAALKDAGTGSLAGLLGLRPGESLNCIHATETPEGCGGARACRVCGAYKTIIACQISRKATEGEARLNFMVNGRDESRDMRITASPLRLDDEDYCIVTLSDISHEKRRRILERVFFHDIINSAGGLVGLAELMRQIEDPAEIRQLIHELQHVTGTLMDEILAQRELSAAENGDLQLSLQDVPLRLVAAQAVQSLIHHSVAKTRTIEFSSVPITLAARSDLSILRRVILNMLKNALEATPPGGTVVISPHVSPDGHVGLSVQNPGLIPEDVQLQLFQRSFSTKGANRGLGTYGMKLFTERYLGGRIYFVSRSDIGTVFTVELPPSAESQVGQMAPLHSSSR